MLDEAKTAMCYVINWTDFESIPVDDWVLAMEHALLRLDQHAVGAGRSKDKVSQVKVRQAIAPFGTMTDRFPCLMSLHSVP